MRDIQAVRPQELAKDIVILDGLGGSGKSMIAPILSSLKRGELWLLDHTFEYIATLYECGKIEKDAAISLLKLYADLDLYNLSIGRNVNFRETDDSSAQKNSLLERYEQRLAFSDGDEAVTRIEAQQPILFLMTHFILGFSSILFESFGERLKSFIVSLRHPAWTIESWFNGNWADRIGKDPREFQLCHLHDGDLVPWFALGWEAEYLKSSKLEKAINVTSFLDEKGKQVRAELADPEKIMLIPFEKFTTKPEHYLAEIAGRLNTEQTTLTKAVMDRMNVPRIFQKGSINEQKQRVNDLARTESLSSEARQKLSQLYEEYEDCYLS